MMLNFDCRPSGLYEMDKKDFDPLAEQILLEKQPEVLKKAMPLDIDALIQDGFPLECHDAILSKDCSILGLITFMDKNLPIYDDEFHEISIATTTGTILVDKRLRNKPTRYRFTKAHELSHWIKRRYKMEFNEKQTFSKALTELRRIKEQVSSLIRIFEVMYYKDQNSEPYDPDEYMEKWLVETDIDPNTSEI